MEEGKVLELGKAFMVGCFGFRHRLGFAVRLGAGRGKWGGGGDVDEVMSALGRS